MATWVFVFIACLICPLMMLIYGIRFSRFQPKKEGFCGVRTKAALKNDETWDYAHQYCGQMWENMGIIMACVVVAAMMILFRFNELIIAVSGVFIVFIQFILFVLSFAFVSKAIVKKFGK